MSKVQRYEDGGYNGYGVIEDDDGEYVLYSDYADLERQRDELVDLLTDMDRYLDSGNNKTAICQTSLFHHAIKEALARAEKT